ncbi:MAG: ABC transporter permease subunit [Planctomycetes bacterium]|nr:ABC transporter permease subunit [Planctomycetota bacterium]MCP4771673.1 ABC transporter permease subunit [Planctomycetota bacterium]MCP4860027.1 ABC transporter permease subunit [Planctomycetota bacterium]
MSLVLGARSARPWWSLAIVVTFVAAWIPLLPLLEPLIRFDRLSTMLDARTSGLLWRSTWISTLSALLAIAIGWPYAMLCTRWRFPGAGLFRLLMPLPLLMPPLMVAQAWFGLTGMTGISATIFTFGVCYAPLPALLVARSLGKQSAASFESAMLISPRFAILSMLRISLLPALIGGGFAFLFAAGDFAVPDYFATVGDLFHVYAAEIFGHSRNADFTAGATASLPLVLIGLLVLLGNARLLKSQLGYESGLGRHACPTNAKGAAQAILPLLLLALLAVLLIAPIAQIFFETGKQGPLSERTWSDVSRAAFQQGITDGRSSLVRTMQFAGLAGALCLLLAPLWAHLILHCRNRWRSLLVILLCLPLLVPSVALGFGSILMFNQPWLDQFYSSLFLPALLIAGRFLPIAVFILLDIMSRVPDAQEETAELAGCSYLQRLFRYRLGGHTSALWLAAGLVIAFGARELDFAILLPAANSSAAVRYYNALHFARDNFVAAYGIILVALLFLPVMFHAWWQSIRFKD